MVSEIRHVYGTVEGKVVLIAGKVDGDLLVHERLEVNSTANVLGEVRVPSGQLLIQEVTQLKFLLTSSYGITSTLRNSGESNHLNGVTYKQ